MIIAEIGAVLRHGRLRRSAPPGGPHRRGTHRKVSEELRWARRVDEAFRAAEAAGVSSIRLDDGTFVDYPIAHRAQALLAEDDPRHGHEQSPRKPPA